MNKLHPMLRASIATALVMLLLLQTSCLYSERKGMVSSGGAVSMMIFTAVYLMAASVADDFYDFYDYYYRDEDVPLPEAIYEYSLATHIPPGLVELALLIDPLIMQVPADATGITGTYNDYQGHSGSLIVRGGLSSVPVTKYKSIIAEPGQQLVILEMPDQPGLIPQSGQPARWFELNLNFNVNPAREIQVKCISTGKITAGGTSYFIPLCPAVTDFSLVPSITIPRSATPRDLVLPTGPSLPKPRARVVYGFAETAPAGDLNLDWLRDDTDLDLLADYLAEKIEQGERDFVAPLSQADLNADGQVDVVDLLLMRK